MKKLSIEEIRKTELDLLCWFDTFCRERELTYVLCGGTLLGAVRHKGFIPWDDDIDVLMPRNDYDKLLAMGGFHEEYRRFVSWRTGEIVYPFIKLMDMRTEVREKYMSGNLVSHVWMDIFPFDGMPDDDRYIRRRFRQIRRLRYLIYAAGGEAGKGSTRLAAAAKTILVPLLKRTDLQKVCEKMNRLSSAVPIEGAPYVGGFVWGYGPQEKMPRTMLETVPVEFEGHQFPAPACWDMYLTQLFGNYMELPPEDKRILHGFEAWWKE